jgi:hypothetical protein
VASPKQIEANRANARRSTGPRSEDGKSRSSKNALQHGLKSREIVIWGENPDQFEVLRAGLEADFRPTSIIECELIDRLAGLLWRLRRIPALEAALIDPVQKEDKEAHIASLLFMADKETREKVQKQLKEFRERYPEEEEPSVGMHEEETWRDRGGREWTNAEIDARKNIQDSLVFIQGNGPENGIGSRYETSLMNAAARTLSLLHSIQTAGLVKGNRQ